MNQTHGCKLDYSLMNCSKMFGCEQVYTHMRINCGRSFIQRRGVPNILFVFYSVRIVVSRANRAFVFGRIVMKEIRRIWTKRYSAAMNDAVVRQCSACMALVQLGHATAASLTVWVIIIIIIYLLRVYNVYNMSISKQVSRTKRHEVH